MNSHSIFPVFEALLLAHYGEHLGGDELPVQLLDAFSVYPWAVELILVQFPSEGATRHLNDVSLDIAGNIFKYVCIRKQGNGLFNDVLNTFVIRLYGRKEGNVLFNDTLNTFYLRLYGVRHIMVKDHSDSKRKLAAARWATLSG